MNHKISELISLTQERISSVDPKDTEGFQYIKSLLMELYNILEQDGVSFKVEIPNKELIKPTNTKCTNILQVFMHPILLKLVKSFARKHNITGNKGYELYENQIKYCIKNKSEFYTYVLSNRHRFMDTGVIDIEQIKFVMGIIEFLNTYGIANCSDNISILEFLKGDFSTFQVSQTNRVNKETIQFTKPIIFYIQSEIDRFANNSFKEYLDNFKTVDYKTLEIIAESYCLIESLFVHNNHNINCCQLIDKDNNYINIDGEEHFIKGKNIYINGQCYIKLHKLITNRYSNDGSSDFCLLDTKTGKPISFKINDVNISFINDLQVFDDKLLFKYDGTYSFYSITAFSKIQIQIDGKLVDEFLSCKSIYYYNKEYIQLGFRDGDVNKYILLETNGRFISFKGNDEISFYFEPNGSYSYGLKVHMDDYGDGILLDSNFLIRTIKDDEGSDFSQILGLDKLNSGELIVTTLKGTFIFDQDWNNLLLSPLMRFNKFLNGSIKLGKQYIQYFKNIDDEGNCIKNSKSFALFMNKSLIAFEINGTISYLFDDCIDLPEYDFSKNSRELKYRFKEYIQNKYPQFAQFCIVIMDKQINLIGIYESAKPTGDSRICILGENIKLNESDLNDIKSAIKYDI